jgi:hypothetical protein
VTVPPFEATHPFGFFDYFRVPYRVAPRPDGEPRDPLGRFCGRLRDAAGGGASLMWLRAGGHGGLPGGAAKLGRYTLNGGTLFGHVVPDPVAHDWLSGSGDGWRPAEPIADEAGRRVASVWRDAAGSVFLPFDPDEVSHRFWSERYGSTSQATARSLLLKAYYAARPAIPRAVQIALRKAFSRVQRTASFPRWPIETSLHDLHEWLFAQVVALAGGPVPWLDLWPDGRSWALVLTHDVETSTGYRDLHLLRDVERTLGYASSWNFVPLRYQVGDDVLGALREEGCEIGVHGLRHDGRDLGSLRLLRRRLPAIREHARRWRAVGFRAPATQRAWEWMPLLGFEYDSSYHDTAPYEPTPGGSCSYLPYFIEDLVELPITLPQDHTVFTILQHPDEAVWIRKAAHLRSRRGMALVLTHPDYAGDRRLVDGYRRLLESARDDPTAWRALPREVSDWWRRRAGSTLEETATGWTIRGPAATDGAVSFAQPGEATLAADGAHAGVEQP